MSMMKIKTPAVLFLSVLLIAAAGIMPAFADEGVTGVETSTVTQTSEQTGGAVVSDCEISYEISQSSLNTYTVTIPKKVKFTSKTPSVTVSGEAALETGKALIVSLDSGDCQLTNSAGQSIPYSVLRTGVAGVTLTDLSMVGKIIGGGSTDSFTTTLTFNLGTTSGLPAGTYTDTITFRTYVQSSS